MMGENNENQQYEGQHSNIKLQCTLLYQWSRLLQQVQMWIKHGYVAGIKNIQYNLTRQDIDLSHFKVILINNVE